MALVPWQVWLNSEDGMCGLHCDAPNSLLVVLAGSKRVALLHPCAPAVLKLDTRGDSGINIGYDVFADERFEEGASAHGMRHIVTLGRGDAVFIPAGWYHQVHSCAQTVGVSIPVCSVSTSL